MATAEEFLDQIRQETPPVRKINDLLRETDSNFDGDSEESDHQAGKAKLDAVRAYFEEKYDSEDEEINPYDERCLEYLAQQEEKHLGGTQPITEELQDKDEFESY